MTTNSLDWEKPLLDRRIPRSNIVLGRAYVMYARKGGVGVAVMEKGQLGYRYRREKFERIYLFVEYDWDQGPPHGTAIPLAEITQIPPDDDDELLSWLLDQEKKHREEIDEAKQIIYERAKGALKRKG